MIYEVLLFLHVIGACVLLGTGAGIAFFMLMAHRSNDPAIIAHTASIVVIADMIFTATAVITQPVTGVMLALNAGWTIFEGWVLAALILYCITGAFWLPVVWIQIRLRKFAVQARDTHQALPSGYYRLFRIWFVCGVPAFAAVLAILWLMLTKPDLPF